MAVRIFLIVLTITCGLASTYQYFSEPLGVEDLFARKEIYIEGEAVRWQPSKGALRIEIATSKRGIIYMDCMPAEQICASPKAVKIQGVFFHLDYAAYWPSSLTVDGVATLDEQQSKQIYGLYREKSRQLYKIWLALALAFAILSVVMGRRPVG